MYGRDGECAHTLGTAGSAHLQECILPARRGATQIISNHGEGQASEWQSKYKDNAWFCYVHPRETRRLLWPVLFEGWASTVSLRRASPLRWFKGVRREEGQTVSKPRMASTAAQQDPLYASDRTTPREGMVPWKSAPSGARLTNTRKAKSLFCVEVCNRCAEELTNPCPATFHFATLTGCCWSCPAHLRAWRNGNSQRDIAHQVCWGTY